MTTERALRADGRRSIEAIIDAGARVLADDPRASVAAIADSAGVGRVTVYGHFPARSDLVRAVVEQAITSGEDALRALDLAGDPVEALATLVAASWQQIARIGALMTAATSALSPAELRGLHDAPAARVLDLLRRGQASGAFRSDLPETWLVDVVHGLMQTASVEVENGRLGSGDAPRLITASALACWAAARA